MVFENTTKLTSTFSPADSYMKNRNSSMSSPPSTEINFNLNKGCPLFEALSIFWLQNSFLKNERVALGSSKVFFF